MNTIETRELVRKFGDLTAVDKVTFQVKQGEIFGLLGPNGAGKTTTIKMLCTLLRPTSGTATVAGYDVVHQRTKVRQSIGLVFQDPSLDDRLTAMQNLHFHAMLFNIPGDVFKERVSELLEIVELTERAKNEVRTFSGGMKRRLEIARGLLHHPQVLFLDEPTLGLDPQTRHHIWEYIIAMRKKEGLSILLTTHYMDEVEHADRVLIIDHGQVVALDTPERLKGMVGGDVITLKTENDEIAAQRLKEKFQIEARRVKEELILEVPRGDKFIPKLLSTLGNGTRAIEVHSVSLRRPSMDDVFIKMTGHAIRDEEASAKDGLRANVHMRRRR
ncbi:MAG: ATP-binding cassette domain-containing protein [Dehalococcoidia bacterium]|nr:ATP-binding cassette domain-containing protein [Dehalococcoidia bacterium]